MNRFRNLIALLFLVLPLLNLTADQKITDKISLDTEFYFRTNDQIAYTDYFKLGVELDGRFEPSDNWELGLKIDAAYDRVNAEDIWLRYKGSGRMRYQLGLFENEILLEDQFSSIDVPFRTDALIRRHMDYSGWYSSRATGLKVYRNFKEETLPLSTFAHLFFHPGGREVQLNTGAYYPFGQKEDRWIGFSGAWYPYIVHNNWIGQEKTYAQDNNFIFQGVIADTGGDIIYRGSVTTGSNLVDPVGITHLPGNGEPSWFAGADLMAGLNIGDKKFRWIPGLEASWLTYDLNTPDCWRLDLRTGQQLAWDKTFYLHLEGGLGILTNYSDGAQEILQTALEGLWGISLQVRL
ncbi:MAG: hypothetical protein PQJ58_15620 [Spirochaetales bacterium]|nr:hypothetical protein [Spirochaetales bacterium]